MAKIPSEYVELLDKTKIGVYTLIVMTMKLKLDMAAGEEILCTTTRLRQASRMVTQFYDKMLQDSGILSTQLPLLAIIRTAGTITISGLAEKAVIDRTTLTRNLRLLEKDGLIQSETGKDRRRRELSITKKGKTAIEKAYPLWEKAQRQVIEGLGEKRWQELLHRLKDTIATVQDE